MAGAIYTYLSYRTTAAKLIVTRPEMARRPPSGCSDELDKLAGELEPAARSQSLYLGLTGKQRGDPPRPDPAAEHVRRRR